MKRLHPTHEAVVFPWVYNCSVCVGRVLLNSKVPEGFKVKGTENMERNLNEYLQTKNRFQERQSFSDITLVVEDQKLHVHKTLLMMHSPVFEKMFTDEFKEKNLCEISLPGKKYSAIVNLLEQIYPGDGAYLLKDEILEDLLQLADEYDIQQVFTNCGLYLDKKLNEETLEDLIKIAAEYDTQELTNAKGYIVTQLNRDCSGTPSTDRILFYLGIVERYPRLHALRERFVAQTSRIPVREMEKSKHFLSVPATATRDALLLQAKNTWNRFEELKSRKIFSQWDYEWESPD